MSERGQYAKGKERRESILRATLEVFAQKGYRGTSLRAIARELNIGPGLIQHYFESREHLLIEIIRTWDFENGRRGEGLTKLDSWLLAVRHNMSIPGLIHLYSVFALEATDADHPARAFFEWRYNDLTSAMIDDLNNRKRLGTAAQDLDVHLATRDLIAWCEGMQIRWLFSPTFDMYYYFVDYLHRLGVEVDMSLSDIDVTVDGPTHAGRAEVIG